MGTQSAEVAIGVTTLAGALVAGAVFSRLHNGSTGGHNPVGDRVFCGLLAAPLFVLLAHLTVPSSGAITKLSAGAPILIYSGLLAATDWKWKIAETHFTAMLFCSIVAVYASLVIAWIAGAA